MPVQLSVIIVNYNVEHFLEQCLLSLFKASKSLEVEVWVVDNNSVDGSVSMVKEKFPAVRLIANTDNKGFSKANNQAIEKASGEYVLLLNPDTVVEEDTFVKILAFMDSKPNVGGLGVKMIDGKGNFLPESKRGLPTPWVALFKIVGLSALFPKSKLFGKYHLGYLDKDKTHSVEILSGAFMLIRKKVLDTIGLLDETFFMYGEDIDISYRILKAGYENSYFADTRIIHYKGESTKKSSVNYVLVFYKAMIIFARKHFSGQYASLFSFFIHIAIYLRAAIAILNRFFTAILLPLLDFSFIFMGIYTIKNYYEIEVKNIHFPEEAVRYILPAYTAIWVMSILFNKGYQKPIQPLQAVKGIAIGTLVILAIYGLLPESVRFSRMIIFLGTFWALLITPMLRYLLSLVSINYSLKKNKKKNIFILGEQSEVERVENVLAQSAVNYAIVANKGIDIKGLNQEQLNDIIRVHKVDELIFCSKNISAQQIMTYMSVNTSTDFKIAPPESAYIIGSNSIHTAGDLYLLESNPINTVANKIKKRLFDLIAAILLLLLSPILIFVVDKKKGLFANIFAVLFSRCTWVGYFQLTNSNASENLPSIKPTILACSSFHKSETTSIEVATNLNYAYAKNYKLTNDLAILLYSIRKIGG